MGKLKKYLVVVLATVIFGSACSAYSGGDGTVGNPYKIGTPADMNQLSLTTADWGKHFVLINDINMAGVEFHGIGISSAFSGVFDGKGFTISNAFISIGEEYFSGGLFGIVSSNAQIKNLAVVDANMIGNINGSRYYGVLVGQNYGTIDKCYASGFISGSGDVGGFVGRNDAGTITNCYSAVVVTNGLEVVGSFIGKNMNITNVQNCFYDANTSGVSVAVGIGTATGIFGKSTIEMKTKSTFTDVGWDFANTWRMCEDGVDYPRFQIEFAKFGDFQCPDGVGFEDFALLANFWLTNNSLTDLDKNNIVDYNDLLIFTQNWLE